MISAFWYSSTNRTELFMSSPTILFIDDEESVLYLRRILFESLGYKVLLAPSDRRGLSTLRENDADLVVLDYAMTEMDGEQTVALLHSSFPNVPIILSSGVVDSSGAGANWNVRPWWVQGRIGSSSSPSNPDFRKSTF